MESLGQGRRDVVISGRKERLNAREKKRDGEIYVWTMSPLLHFSFPFFSSYVSFVVFLSRSWYDYSSFSKGVTFFKDLHRYVRWSSESFALYDLEFWNFRMFLAMRNISLLYSIFCTFLRKLHIRF